MVIFTLETYWRFQNASGNALAKRKSKMFWTGSLPA